jgi:hypothetical protein
MSWGMSETATVLFDRCEATISVVRESSSFWLNFSVIGPRGSIRSTGGEQNIVCSAIGKMVFLLQERRK